MAAFVQPGFVVSIIHDGKVLRESNNNNQRTVRLPFGAEYSLRIHNKSGRRAYARVLIDGTDALGGQRLILQPGQKTDLERFVLDGDMLKGRRLKFVELGHGDVQDPTAKENGEIEVIFERESTLNYIFSSGVDLTPKFNGQQWDPAGVLRGTTFGSTQPQYESRRVDVSYNSCVNSTGGSISSNNFTMPKADAGATVEGSESQQQFQLVSEDFMTDAPVSLKIRLRGPSQPEATMTVSDSCKPVSVQIKNGRPTVLMHGNLGLPVEGEVIEMTATHLVVKLPISAVKLG